MNHEEFRSWLDDHVDGLLSEPERLEMEGHARECGACAAELAALKALVDAAQHLPRDLEPSRDLWPELEARLASPVQHVALPARPGSAAGRSTAPVVEASESRRPPARHAARILDALRAGWQRPWALAGSLVAIVAVLWFAFAPERRETAQETEAALRGPSIPADPGAVLGDQHFSHGLAGLERECMGAGKLLRAALVMSHGTAVQEVASSLAAGLSEVERSIAETRAALAANPGNGTLMRMLAARYREELAILHDAMQRVEEA